MEISAEDLTIVRALVDDAHTLSNVLPDTSSGKHMADDLEFAAVLLSPRSSEQDKATARKEAGNTVHPSNRHKL